MNPGLTGFWQFLIVLAEPSAPAEPGQRPFNHPSARQHLELVAVRSPAHHLQQPSSSLPSPRHQPTGIGRIGPDDLKPGEPAQQLGQHQSGPVPVLDVGGVNHHGPRAARWCPLRCGACARTPCRRRSREAPFFRGLHRLAVDDRPAGSSIPSLALPDHGTQCLQNPLPSAVLAPFSEVPPDRAPRRQVVGHHSPGNTATQHVQDAVHHLPQVHSSGMSPG